MKKYILMRVLRSLVSLFLVTTLTYAIIYSLVPTHLIFKNDTNYNKQVATPDKKVDYESTIFERTGYIVYYNSKELQEKASSFDASVTVNVNDTNKTIYENYIKSLGNGWTLSQMPESGAFYAIRKIPLLERVWKFYANLIEIDHPWRIQDASNPDLERYVRFENDPAIGFSLVGSGTKHKYLIYFNGQFPFIHQNIVGLNLGTSYPTYARVPVLQVISQGQGKSLAKEVTFPTGVTKTSPINIYSRTYRSPSQADSRDIANFGEGDAYTATENNYTDPSMLTSSMIIGLIGVLIAYALAIPIAMLMAHFKESWFDRLSTGATTFLLALPSVALIYVIRFIGSSLFGLPDTFPLYGASDPRSFALPAIVLGIFSVPGLVVWFRRYLIDEQASDYIRFARAKGLSEQEILKKHLFKNAMVPIVSGIPGSILGTIVGATLTEQIFAYPGMGKMLIDAVRQSNNAMVVGLVFIFTLLSVFSVLAGDVLMTMIDPRIKLTTKGGK